VPSSSLSLGADIKPKAKDMFCMVYILYENYIKKDEYFLIICHHNEYQERISTDANAVATSKVSSHHVRVI
jgi:hypothetical protein